MFGQLNWAGPIAPLSLGSFSFTVISHALPAQPLFLPSRFAGSFQVPALMKTNSFGTIHSLPFPHFSEDQAKSFCGRPSEVIKPKTSEIILWRQAANSFLRKTKQRTHFAEDQAAKSFCGRRSSEVILRKTKQRVILRKTKRTHFAEDQLANRLFYQ